MIFVDESFQSGYTIIAAINISDLKVEEAYREIKRQLAKHSVYKNSELKKSEIRRDYSSKTNKAISKIIDVKSKAIKFSKSRCAQHSPEFYVLYSKTLRKLSSIFPNEIIIVDKFSGLENIENHEEYTFISSSSSKGLQLADIAIDNYNLKNDLGF